MKQNGLRLTDRARLAIDQAKLLRCSLHRLREPWVGEAERAEPLHNLLNQAMTVSGAQMANIQIYRSRPAGLYLAITRGFDQRFLRFFARVYDGQSCCGRALQHGRPVLVRDITRSEIFRGTRALEVMLDAGSRAVASFPAWDRHGNLRGMLSVHFRSPRSGFAREGLHLLALLLGEILSEQDVLNGAERGPKVDPP